jgi:hypothetical protein
MGKLRTTIEQLEEMLIAKHGDQITVDTSTFTGMNNKARFIDKKLGEWWATPTKVVVCGQKHPRHNCRTIESIITDIKDRHGETISVDLTTFTKTTEKTRFVDIEYGEFWGFVNKIIRGGCHPKRAELQRIEKIKKNHATEEFKNSMSETIKKCVPKIKATNLVRYGVDCNLNTKEAKEKRKLKSLSPEAQQVKINTKKIRRIRNNEKRRQKKQAIREDKIKQGLLVGSDKRTKTMQENGHFYNIDGLSLKDHWENNFSSIVSYTYFCKMVAKSGASTLDDLRQIVTTISSMTNIEVIMNKNTNLTRFDRYPCKYAGFRPDFKINDRVFVNVDGLYWHCNKIVDDDYHFNLRIKAHNIGLSILQFRADEVIYKNPIVESMIAVKAGLANKLAARKLKIKEIDVATARPFLNQNHLMGFCGATHHIALMLGEEIKSLLSIQMLNDSVKIVRFCGALNTVVVGGYSKLLKYCIKQFKPKQIFTFVDLRYGSVDSLVKLGFNHVGTTLGWKWTDYDKTYNRLQCRANMDDRKLTEKEQAQELKWTRIYDAGQAKLIMDVDNGK